MGSPVKGFILQAFFGMLVLCTRSQVFASNLSEPMGVVTINLSGGSPEAPSFTIVAPGIHGSCIFRGPIEGFVSDNNVSFYRTPELDNPANRKGPFSNGVLGSLQGRASTTLDENGSVSNLNLLFSGNGYRDRPRISLTPPSNPNNSATVYRAATVEAEWNSSLHLITGFSILEKGIGYDQPPEVYIEGGPHYLKIIDTESNYSGFSFLINSNSDHVLELNNSLNLPLGSILLKDTLVEVLPAWTLGSLFGYTEIQLQSDANASRADWIYLLKSSANQIGYNSDYVAHFHNGTEWKLVHSPNDSTAHYKIPPDESVIIARRSEANKVLTFNGISPAIPTTWYLPEFNRTKLVSNPFPTSVKLSDLIGNETITDDNSSAEENSTRWLAHREQDLADNIQILNSSGWSTYWHDGTNLTISKPAVISAKAGSGIGGGLTMRDFSMASGTIQSVTNPLSGNPLITAQNHGLEPGFWIKITGAIGRLTNDEKIQINSLGEEVNTGEGLLINSSINGKWEIINVSTDSFELNHCLVDSDFEENGLAKWTTGDPGEGYDSNVSLSILGGGGQGARAVGIVEGGKITSISLTYGGLFYTNPPTVVVHPGGWNRLGRGEAPINDLLIPAGSGALLIRKHPNGIKSTLPLRSISQD
jgi:hypothetical protein